MWTDLKTQFQSESLVRLKFLDKRRENCDVAARVSHATAGSSARRERSSTGIPGTER
jgi:hypothetical protein